MRISESAGQKTVFYVEGGFVEILNDVVALLTMRAIPASDLDVAETEEKLREAMDRPEKTEALAALKADRVNNYRARLRTAQKYAHR